MPFANEILIGSPANAWTAPTVTQGVPAELHLALTSSDGQAFNLEPYKEQLPGPGSIYGICGALPVSQGVVAVFTEFNGQSQPTAMVTCSVDNDNKVVVPLQATTLGNPGIYIMTFLMVGGGNPEAAVKSQIAVEPNYACRMDNVPVSVAEVRLWMRDNTADDNLLLDEVEFKDREILAALNAAIDIWNGMPPLLRDYNFSPVTFPQQFRHQWIEVTVGLLKKMAANCYLRNNLPYQAAGVSFDERNKFAQYKQEGDLAVQEYKQWVTATKAQCNREQCFTIINFRR